MMRSFKFIMIFALFLSLGIWLSSMTAVAIMYWAQCVGGGVESWLAGKGWDRVMRRCIVAWGMVFLIMFLRSAGWRGWKDCGFVPDDPEWPKRPWWVLVLSGMGVGLITLGCVTVLSMIMGFRSLSPVEGGISLVWRILRYILSGIAVALIEETVCRGVLFRVLARIWRVWPAAIAISMIFALAHFVSPSPEAFEGDSFFSVCVNVFISTFVMVTKAPNFVLWFVNLTLLGVALCAFVIRTKTIWFGIGAHAAWVWVIKIHVYFTDMSPKVQSMPWLGRRGDFMDSFLGTAMLVCLIGCTLFRRAPAGIAMRWKGMKWYVMPRASEDFRTWLERCFSNGSESANRKVLAERRVLKEYEGCLVTVQSGLVLKEYRPRTGLKGIKYAVMPSRARRSFMLARQLIEHGVSTPKPVAWAGRRRFGFLRSAYLVTQEITNAEPLTDWLERDIQDQTIRDQVMAAYGRLTAMFHSRTYSNRDLKHENVMCSVTQPSMLWVVDLDGVRRKWRIFSRRAKRDLMRIGLSLTESGWLREPDICAFFNAYNAGVPARLRRNRFPL